MRKNFILVDLDETEKLILLKEASFFLTDSETIEDLNNKRKKWIRFNKNILSEIIGELTYCYNRSKNNYESMVLDQLIVHLEYYEQYT
jgi:hypothetical protein